MARLPLEGVRVLDLTVVWAGPYGAMFLADWGAEVIRVESCQVPAPHTRGPGQMVRPSREYLLAQKLPANAYPDWEPGARPWNRYSLFNSHARNKLSMTVDLRRPEGRDVFFRLVSISDVVVENNAPSTMEKLGVTYEALRQHNPTVIMVRMPAYGLTGPYREYRAFGIHVEGVVGHTWCRGYPDLDPSRQGEVVASDAAAGISAALAVLLALRHRRRTGQGQLVEVPLAENFIPYMAEPLLEYLLNGRLLGRRGNRHPWMAPHGTYPCQGQDEWVVLAVASDGEFRRLCEVMGQPHLAQDPRFADSLSRWRNQDALDPVIAQWTRGLTPREVAEALQRVGIAAGPVLKAKALLEDPHLCARGFFQPLAHPDCGTHLYPGPLWRMAGVPNPLRAPPCRLGEHNEYVYQGLLGTTMEEYARLEQAGHLGMDYPSEVP